MTSAHFLIYQQPPCRQYQINATSLPFARIWATPTLQTSFVGPCTVLHAMKQVWPKREVPPSARLSVSRQGGMERLLSDGVLGQG